MQKKWVAVFGLGPFQVYALKKLKLSNKIIGFDDNHKAIGRKYVDFFYNTDIKKKKTILKICKKHNVKNVFCFSSDYAIDTIIYLTKELKLDNFKKNLAIKKSAKKDLLKKILNKNKIQTPKYLLIHQDEIKDIVLKSNKYISKPTNLSGSRGVFTFKNKVELKNNLKVFEKYYSRGKLLIEEFIKGKIYAIDGIFYKNNFYTFSLTYKTKGKNSFSDKNLVVNHIDKNLTLESSKLALDCCRALGSVDTIVHLEFIKCKITGKLFVIDLGLRGAGTYIFGSLISKIISLDPAQIEINLGERNFFLSPFKKSSICFYMHMVTTNKKIFFRGINKNYLNKIKPKFYKIFNLKKKNNAINYTKSNYDRLAVIIYKFDNYKELKKNLRKLKTKLIDKKIILK